MCQQSGVFCDSASRQPLRAAGGRGGGGGAAVGPAVRWRQRQQGRRRRRPGLIPDRAGTRAAGGWICDRRVGRRPPRPSEFGRGPVAPAAARHGSHGGTGSCRGAGRSRAGRTAAAGHRRPRGPEAVLRGAGEGRGGRPPGRAVATVTGRAGLPAAAALLRPGGGSRGGRRGALGAGGAAPPLLLDAAAAAAQRRLDGRAARRTSPATDRTGGRTKPPPTVPAAPGSCRRPGLSAAACLPPCQPMGSRSHGRRCGYFPTQNTDYHGRMRRAGWPP